MSTKAAVCEFKSALIEGRVTLDEIKLIRYLLDKGSSERFVVLNRRGKVPVAYYGPLETLDGHGVEERDEMERLDAMASK